MKTGTLTCLFSKCSPQKNPSLTFHLSTVSKCKANNEGIPEGFFFFESL